MTIDAEETAASFDAMAEKERLLERDHRAAGMHHLAAVRSCYAHAWTMAAKSIRDGAKRRAKRVARCGRAA